VQDVNFVQSQVMISFFNSGNSPAVDVNVEYEITFTGFINLILQGAIPPFEVYQQEGKAIPLPLTIEQIEAIEARRADVKLEVIGSYTGQIRDDRYNLPDFCRFYDTFPTTSTGFSRPCKAPPPEIIRQSGPNRD
jgi:hypothetical protein